jgi:hypothetical protein
MVCKVCQEMLFRHKGRIGSGSQLQLNFWHHEKEENVKDSAKETGCYICGVIYDRLKILDMKRFGHAKTQADTEFLLASLRPFSRSRQSGPYRLDFKVKNSKDSIASFVLKHNGMAVWLHRPGILHTGTDALKMRENLKFGKPVPSAQIHCIKMCSP